MSKVILKKEIKKLYLNTVLKIFIRQYRTQTGNHGNCCFIIIFENVSEYLLFEVFLSYLEWIIFLLIDQYTIYFIYLVTRKTLQHEQRLLDHYQQLAKWCYINLINKNT